MSEARRVENWSREEWATIVSPWEISSDSGRTSQAAQWIAVIGSVVVRSCWHETVLTVTAKISAAISSALKQLL